MAVQVSVKVDDGLIRSMLKDHGESYADALRKTLYDMRRRGATVIARTSAQQYDINVGKLNPNTKAGRMKGSLSLEGGLAELQYVYTGRSLNVTEFHGLTKPRLSKRRYEISVRIARGKRTVIGHWAPSRSEGGAYSQESPWMYIGGKKSPFISQFGPVKRVGGGWEGATFGPSVPQMIMNEGDGSSGNAEPEMKQLVALLEERVVHNLTEAGLTLSHG